MGADQKLLDEQVENEMENVFFCYYAATVLGIFFVYMKYVHT